MDTKELFDRIAQRMRSEFDESREAFSHPGIKGANAEKIVRRFFAEHLPKSLDLSSGIVVDSKGSTSKQMDIVISDARNTPILSEGENARVLPAEPVYAVIEVKSVLTANMIPSIVENMLSVKSLNKSAYYKPGGVIEHTYTLYGKEYPIWPILYFVFAFEGEDPYSIEKVISKEHSDRQLPCENRIDTVCIMDSAVIVNAQQKTAGGIDALPSASSALMAYPTKKALLLFYALVANYLNQADCPRFRFKDYIGNIRF